MKRKPVPFRIDGAATVLGLGKIYDTLESSSLPASYDALWIYFGDTSLSGLFRFARIPPPSPLPTVTPSPGTVFVQSFGGYAFVDQIASSIPLSDGAVGRVLSGDYKIEVPAGCQLQTGRAYLGAFDDSLRVVTAANYAIPVESLRRGIGENISLPTKCYFDLELPRYPFDASGNLSWPGNKKNKTGRLHFEFSPCTVTQTSPMLLTPATADAVVSSSSSTLSSFYQCYGTGTTDYYQIAMSSVRSLDFRGTLSPMERPEIFIELNAIPSSTSTKTSFSIVLTDVFLFAQTSTLATAITASNHLVIGGIAPSVVSGGTSVVHHHVSRQSLGRWVGTILSTNDDDLVSITALRASADFSLSWIEDSGCLLMHVPQGPAQALNTMTLSGELVMEFVPGPRVTTLTQLAGPPEILP